MSVSSCQRIVFGEHEMADETTDVAVLGGTPGGVAAAVKAARSGHDVLLVADGRHLGGMMAGGLSYTDTLTMKARSPLLEEFVGAVRAHYAETYGQESSQYAHCENGYVFEPHVAEDIIEALVEGEPRVAVRRGYRPTVVGRANRRIESVEIEAVDAGETREIAADVFVEATYEGDLIAAAGVPYRVGREARTTHDEQFAGRLFTGARGDRYYPREAVGEAVEDSAASDRRGPLDVPADKRGGPLDLIPHPAGLTEIYPHSTGQGDDAIQAYNYRLCLSREPSNRRHPEKPAGYDRADHLAALSEIESSGLRSYLLLRYLPNEKADMNAADLPGENHAYPDASDERREEIADRHRRHALGLLYFLQHDDAVPTEIQERAREWGLAKDEFTENDNFPWQFYVREARRLEGRYLFTENDARHAPGLDRTPIHGDAIAIAEYPLDSHACHAERQFGSKPEGFFYASQVTRPSQVPYRSLLPTGVDNLLVPVPLAATHVAYGGLRLEPTWMHIGEAAGHAAAMGCETDIPPARLDVSKLQSRLVGNGIMLSFFNELDMDTDAPWVESVQYLGTKGFFAGYDARPTATLDDRTADVWASAAGTVVRGEGDDPNERARNLPAAGDGFLTRGEFVERLETESGERVASAIGGPEDDPITRGTACRLLFDLIRPP